MRLISPSKVAAILGVSRWESAYSLWMRMKGYCPPKEPQDLFRVGLAFEHAMAELYRQDHPDWRLSRGEVQYETDAFGFPACATIDRRATKGRRRRVVEFKIAHHTDEWGDEFTGDCPIDYTAQVICQMLFTGFTNEPAHLMVLTHWFKHYTYEIQFDPAVAEWIVLRCKEFYHSRSANDPPPLDDSVATYSAVRAMHPDIDAGTTVDIPVELAEQLHAAKAAVNLAENTLRGVKSRVLDLMANAQYGMSGGRTVVERRVHRAHGVALYLAK